MTLKLTYLVKAIGVLEERTVEEASGGDLREVQHVLADSDTRAGRQIRSSPEYSVREILNGEVRVWLNFDKGLEIHVQLSVIFTKKKKSSRENEVGCVKTATLFMYLWRRASDVMANTIFCYLFRVKILLLNCFK